MRTTDEALAWAAGLYDGEGSASMYMPRKRKTARRQMQVSQAGVLGVHPLVLVRFREIVGHGNVTGPYRGYLYYWKTTRKDVVDEIAVRLWPYLSLDKKRQFTAMTRRARRPRVLVPRVNRTQETERAWAAGLFDGEGSLFVVAKARYPLWRGLTLELPQSSATGVPDVLVRFRAVVQAGSITGPRTSRNPWSKLPQYRWRVSGRHQVSQVVRVLWPHLSSVNRDRVLAVRDLLDPEEAWTLSEGSTSSDGTGSVNSACTRSP